MNERPPGGGKEEGRNVGIVSRLQSGGWFQLSLCTTMIFSQLPKGRLLQADSDPRKETALVLTSQKPEVELTKAQTINLGSFQPW